MWAATRPPTIPAHIFPFRNMAEIDAPKSETASKKTTYDADDLSSLKGLEAVRKKPGMYIGGTDERALHHCVSEVLDNSVDEFLAGHCTHIDVNIHSDGSISIRDNGRGIPVDINKEEGIPGVELVLTRLHRHPGASQSELAEIMEVEKASAGRMIDRLEAKGWVERRADPADRRINRLYLTPAAERVRNRMMQVVAETVEDALGELVGPEADQLAHLLGKVKGRLTGLAAGDGGPANVSERTGARDDARSGAEGTAEMVTP